MAPIPSTISPTRPDSSRAVSWRSRPRSDQPPPHLRNEDDLHRDDARGDQAEPEILHHDEHQAVSAWPPSSAGCTKASPMKPPSGSTSSFTMVATSADFTRLKWLGGKAQHPIDQLEADAPQHPLAEAALVGIDVEFEEAVDDDQQQEHDAQRDQRLLAVEFECHRKTSTWPMKRQVEGDGA